MQQPSPSSSPGLQRANSQPRVLRRLAVGASVCALFVLVSACAPEERVKDGDGGSAGISAGGASGSGGSAASGGTAGSGGNGGTSGDGGTGAGGSGGTGAGGSGGTGAVGGSAGVGGTTGGSAGTGGTTGGSAGAGGSTGGTGGATCGTTDPDCECDGPNVVPKDSDNDTHGSKDCAAAPGDDCDDNDNSFFQNACGGCTKNIGGMPGTSCNDCGILQCAGLNGTSCQSPSPAPKQCGSGSNVQSCVGGTWVNSSTCTGSKPACHLGACVTCRPGTFKCVSFSNGDTAVVRCDAGTLSWASSHVVSCYAAQSKTCNANTGTCVNGAISARDMELNVPKALGAEPSTHRPGSRSTADVLDLATGFEFG